MNYVIFRFLFLNFILNIISRIFVDSDNEDDETKFVDDDDEDDEVRPSNHQSANDDDEEDELDKFMAGIEVHTKIVVAVHQNTVIGQPFSIATLWEFTFATCKCVA